MEELLAKVARLVNEYVIKFTVPDEIASELCGEYDSEKRLCIYVNIRLNRVDITLLEDALTESLPPFVKVNHTTLCYPKREDGDKLHAPHLWIDTTAETYENDFAKLKALWPSLTMEVTQYHKSIRSIT